MRMPEMPLEPVVRADVGIGPYGEAPEDEDRIHELLAWVNRRTRGTDCHGHDGLAMTDTKGGAA